MAGYNSMQIETAFNKLIALKVCGNENGKSEDIEASKVSAYQIMNNWSFGELDTFYENGIEISSLNELYPIIVGYALITRYNLSYDEYVAWCRKQKDEYVYDLLKLIGIEDQERRIEKEKKEKDWRDSEYTVLAKLIEGKNKIINYTEENTGITLFGKNVEIDGISAEIKYILFGVKDAYKYGITIFKNEFNKKCTGFKEAYEFIDRVLDDAREAQWIRIKSYLRKIDVSDELLSEMHKTYVDAADFSYIKKNLEKKYNDTILGKLGNKVQDIIVEDATRKSTHFEGGGFGVSGAIKGMIGAGIANAAYDTLSDMATRVSVENAREQLISEADRLFTGKETKEFCRQYIEAASKILQFICLRSIFFEQLETDTEVEDILEALEKYIDDLSGEDLRKLASNLIFIYPHLTDAYDFAHEHFVGIDQELVSIAEHFGLEDDVAYDSKMVYRTQKCAVFSDMQICEQNDGILLDFLSYAGSGYKVQLPFPIDFIDRKSWKYTINGSIAQDAYMVNQSSGICIRYWGGVEGKETYEEEAAMTSAQTLEQVNSWNNFTVKDFSQDVKKYGVSQKMG